MFDVAQRRLARSVRALTGIVLASVLAIPASVACAQGGVDEKKINDLIGKMTLEEKIHMLSGATLMSSAGVKRLGIPDFRMSDGPSGAHIPPPSTAYAAGIAASCGLDIALAGWITIRSTLRFRAITCRGARPLYRGRVRALCC